MLPFDDTFRTLAHDDDDDDDDDDGDDVDDDVYLDSKNAPRSPCACTFYKNTRPHDMVHVSFRLSRRGEYAPSDHYSENPLL